MIRVVAVAYTSQSEASGARGGGGTHLSARVPKHDQGRSAQPSQALACQRPRTTPLTAAHELDAKEVRPRAARDVIRLRVRRAAEAGHHRVGGALHGHRHAGRLARAHDAVHGKVANGQVHVEQACSGGVR